MLKKEAIKQLLNVKSILFQINELDYTLPLSSLKNATIGKHVRHIIEFYQCLLFRNFESTVNYDCRKRNLLLEENLKYTEDIITEIIDKIELIHSNERLLLISEYDSQQIEMESSLFRELTYNIEHTVHHLAIIGIAIPVHLSYINLLENFGYADSTVKYSKSKTVA